tara:strand:+ start:247 stop:378 length:132 start_codon:yes stop_codon:yes gene_type:complete
MPTYPWEKTPVEIRYGLSTKKTFAMIISINLPHLRADAWIMRL